MNNNRKALGRGLSALVSTKGIAGNAARNVTQEPPKEKIHVVEKTIVQATSSLPTTSLKISLVEPNPNQPRKEFKENELQELTESVKVHGILQPILVRKNGSKYQIVAGERRYRAAIAANLTEVPVLIKEMDDSTCAQVALIENVQRENLNAVETANAYKKLCDEFKMTQQEVADKVGKDRATVANFIRILSLSETALSLLKEGEISFGHAKALLMIKDQPAQTSLAKKAATENLSVRALEEITAKAYILDSGKVKHKKKSEAEDNELYSDILDSLRKTLGTKVAIKQQPNGNGKIEISYFSEDERDRVVDCILGI